MRDKSGEGSVDGGSVADRYRSEIARREAGESPYIVTLGKKDKETAKKDVEEVGGKMKYDDLGINSISAYLTEKQARALQGKGYEVKECRQCALSSPHDRYGPNKNKRLTCDR